MISAKSGHGCWMKIKKEIVGFPFFLFKAQGFDGFKFTGGIRRIETKHHPDRQGEDQGKQDGIQAENDIEIRDVGDQ